LDLGNVRVRTNFIGTEGGKLMGQRRRDTRGLEDSSVLPGGVDGENHFSKGTWHSSGRCGGRGKWKFAVEELADTKKKKKKKRMRRKEKDRSAEKEARNV